MADFSHHEIEPNVLLTTYDRISNGGGYPPGSNGCCDAIFSMRVHIARSVSETSTTAPPQNWTVLPDTDFVGAMAYSSTPVNSIDECAAQCLARSDCVATSWNGPKSLLHNRLCNFDCKTSGRRHLKGETGAVMTSRHGSNLCNKPHPPPPPAPPPPPLPDDWQARVSTGWFIASTGQPLSSDLCPTIGNGFVAASICPPRSGKGYKT